MGAMTWTLLWGLVAVGILTVGYFWLRPKDTTADEAKQAVKRLNKREQMRKFREGPK